MAKRIAFVQSYPYESFSGGDGAYISNLRAFLTSRGHEVVSLISDIGRGRSNPLVKFQDGCGASDRRVKNAICIGENRYISTSIPMYMKLLSRIFKPHPMVRASFGEHEVSWVRRNLSSDAYDCIFLFFDAVHLCGVLGPLPAQVVAVPGFFDLSVRIGSSDSAESRPEVDPSLIDNLNKADFVALNNQHGLRACARFVAQNKLMLIGMSYPKVDAVSSDPGQVVILVGAKTGNNIRSANWFVKKIWPLILHRRPDARLRLVGRVAEECTSGVRSVDYVGQVDDLSHEYRNARVVVAPLVEGSAGVKTKVVEAFSFGRAVVTTSIGVDEELVRSYGPALDIFDDVEGFATAVSDVLGDERLWREKCDLSRACYDSFYSPDAAYGPMTRALAL